MLPVSINALALCANLVLYIEVFAWARAHGRTADATARLCMVFSGAVSGSSAGYLFVAWLLQ